MERSSISWIWSKCLGFVGSRSIPKQALEEALKRADLIAVFLALLLHAGVGLALFLTPAGRKTGSQPVEVDLVHSPTRAPSAPGPGPASPAPLPPPRLKVARRKSIIPSAAPPERVTSAPPKA